MEEFDVVVVGAGPAGSITAKYAAMGGASVLLLEKRQEIGSPVRCGEGISRKWLDEVGIKPDKRWIAHEVKGGKVIAPDGTEFRVDEEHAGDEVGAVIERDIFDKALAEDAVKAGADLRLKSAVRGLIFDEEGKVSGVKVKSFEGTYEVRAGAVVGADGFESQVGRWGGIDTTLKPKDITSAIQYRMVDIDLDPDYAEFYLGTTWAPGGYVWIFPKSETSANVGVGVLLSKIKEPGDAKKHLDKFIENRPGLKKGRIIEIVSGGVPVSAPLDETVKDGLLLVGDAARQTNPLTGGGIANSCIAGKIAGEVLAEATKKGDFSASFLMKYENGWRDRLEEEQYRNWMAKEKLIGLDDDTLNKLIGVLSDAKIDELSVYRILEEIRKRYPELVEEIENLL